MVILIILFLSDIFLLKKVVLKLMNKYFRRKISHSRLVKLPSNNVTLVNNNSQLESHPLILNPRENTLMDVSTSNTHNLTPHNLEINMESLVNSTILNSIPTTKMSSVNFDEIISEYNDTNISSLDE